MVRSRGRFVWYELMTPDVDAATAFYCNIVGWSAKDASQRGMRYTLLTAGNESVCGLLQLSAEASRMGARPNWLGYVGVDDVDAAVRRVADLGGTVHVAATDIPDKSRFSIVADPQSTAFALFRWLRADPQPPPDVAAPGQVGWHELLADDWETAWPFYSGLLGWQKAVAETGVLGTYQHFSADGQPIGGMFTKPATVPAPFWLYYFNVGDIDAAVTRVKAGRGQVLNGPMQVLGGKVVVQCTDPQGAIFALMGPRSRAGIGKPRYEQITVFKADLANLSPARKTRGKTSADLSPDHAASKRVLG